ncbi:Ca2+/calmodulin-dependent protein kinase [Cercospora zeina]
MCFGRLPYANADDINEENEDLDELKAEIKKWSGFNDESRMRPDLPERLYKYLRRLLSVDPNERPSTEEILASIKGGVALGDGAWATEEHTARVSAIDSPKPSMRPRKPSYFSPRPGLPSPVRQHANDSFRTKSPLKQERSRSRPLSPSDGSLAITPHPIEFADAAKPKTHASATGDQHCACDEYGPILVFRGGDAGRVLHDQAACVIDSLHTICTKSMAPLSIAWARGTGSRSDTLQHTKFATATGLSRSGGIGAQAIQPAM